MVVAGPRRRTGRERAAGGRAGATPLGRTRRCGLVELNGDVAGDLGRAAATLGRRPGLRVQVLTAVVAALRQAGAVESWVWPVHLLLSVALHEEVNRHHPRTLQHTEISHIHLIHISHSNLPGEFESCPTLNECSQIGLFWGSVPNSLRLTFYALFRGE